MRACVCTVRACVCVCWDGGGGVPRPLIYMVSFYVEEGLKLLGASGKWLFLWSGRSVCEGSSETSFGGKSKFVRESLKLLEYIGG